MSKAFSILGAVAVLAVTLTAPAMARPFFQSDLVCDVTPTKDGVFTDLLPQRPEVVIQHPSGDLWISNVYGLPPNTGFLCQVFCLLGPGGSHEELCGVTDASGKLAAQRIKGFASKENLGTVCGWPIFRFFDTGGAPAECVSGFAHRGE